jgi:hypothetical protein
MIAPTTRETKSALISISLPPNSTCGVKKTGEHLARPSPAEKHRIKPKLLVMMGAVLVLGNHKMDKTMSTCNRTAQRGYE